MTTLLCKVHNCVLSLCTMLRTKSQRRDICKDCPVAKVADLVGDSCSLLIIRDVIEKPRRFGELQDSLKGISSRTLTKKLQLLEKDGLIARKECNEHPPRVEYSATNKGAALESVIGAMRSYGKKYL